MQDQNKTKMELINELMELRRRITELRALEKEHKRAEEALRESEGRFKQIAENVGEWIWEVDTNGLYTYSSPVVEKILGYKPEEIIKKKYFYDFFSPNVMEDLKKAAFEIFCRREPIRNFLNPNLHKNGDLVYLETNGTPVIDGKGNLIGYRGADTNITERKRMEEDLRKSEEKFKKLFDNAPVGYHEFDIEGRITNVNRTELEMLGYILEEMIGQFVWSFITEGEKSRQAVLGKLTGVILPARSLERTYRRKDGTIIPVLIQDQLLQDEKGRITGIRSTIQDFTERKHAEEAFQRSEEEAKKLARENAIMAEIGKIISSTLDIEDVYERFADEVHKIIPFDRIVINVINVEKGTVSNVYMAGKGVGDRKVGVVYPLEGSGNAEMVRTKSSFLVQTEDFNEYKDRFPMLLSTFQAGFRSIMNVPLFSKGQIIGGLLLRSLKPYAYTDEDVRLAERVGDQIAGAITNAYLFIERKQIEEERERLILQLQDALAEVKQLSGLLPICASCKKIRDDKGYWNQIEEYICDHSDAIFSHSLCPDCLKKLYPDI